MSILSKLPRVRTSLPKRIGRGYGSGVGGHTSTRGGKGHTARTGGKTPLWFEGGQLPLIRRLPWWRGKSRFESLVTVQEVKLADIVAHDLAEVTLESLAQVGLIRLKKGNVRVITPVKLEKAFTFKGVAVSAPVQKAVEEAGGSVTL